MTMIKHILFINLTVSNLLLYPQSLDRHIYTKVLIFKDQQKINVYSSYKGHDIIYSIMNDTIKQDYFVLEILDTREGRYKVEATSILYKGLVGWIDLNNVGINTRSREGKLHLYSQPSYKNTYISVDEPISNRIVRVTAISQDWLKIIWIDNKDYWLPPEYQCPLPYTTCN
jgi:hypothetical protein